MNWMKNGLLVWAGLSISTICGAQSFNLDIDSEFSPPEGGGGAPSSSFGAAAGQTGFWDTFLVQSQPPKLLRDVTGNLTGVLMTGPAGGTGGGFNNPLNSGDHRRLLNDAAGVPLSNTYLFSNLANGTYKVFTYAVSPNNGVTTARVTVAGSITSNPQFVTGPMPGNQFVLGITHSVHDIVVSSGTLSVTIDRTQGQPSAFVNGLQIVTVPEPSLLIISGIGCTFLLTKRKAAKKNCICSDN